MAKTLSFSFTFFLFLFLFSLNMVKAAEVTQHPESHTKKGQWSSTSFLVSRYCCCRMKYYNMLCHLVLTTQLLFSFAWRCNPTKIVARIPTQHLNYSTFLTPAKPKSNPKKQTNKNFTLQARLTFFFEMAVPKFTVVIVVWTLAGWIAREGTECVSGGFVLIWSHCVGSLWSSRGGLWVVCPGGW